MKQKPLIYIIEDSIIVQNLIEYSLKKELDCNFVCFTRADIALKQIDIQRPDLIILDYFLDSNYKNSITGLKILKILRRKDLMSPTIVFSGQTEKNIAVKLMKMGAVDYISKNSEEFISELVKSVIVTLNFINIKDENEFLKLKARGQISHLTLIAIILLIIILSIFFIM